VEAHAFRRGITLDGESAFRRCGSASLFGTAAKQAAEKGTRVVILTVMANEDSTT
jgi:hypothetical protein